MNVQISWQINTTRIETYHKLEAIIDEYTNLDEDKQ